MRPQMVPQWHIEAWVERMAQQAICRVPHMWISQICAASKIQLLRKPTKLLTMQVVSLQIEFLRKLKLHNWVHRAYMLTRWSLPNLDNKTTQTTTSPLPPKRSRTKSSINSHTQWTKKIASQTTLRVMCTIRVFTRAVKCRWAHRHWECTWPNRLRNRF